MIKIRRSTNNGSSTLHICKICKSLERSANLQNTTAKIGLRDSQEQLPNFSLHASTPVHPVAATKAPATVKRVASVKASSNRKLSTSVTNIVEKNSSNDILESNNSSNNSRKNSSNNNDNNSATSEKEVINSLSDSSNLSYVQLPRSRMSTFAPTPLLASASAFEATATSFSPVRNTSRLDTSQLKNSTMISFLVTYANLIRDTVEGAITSQQGSIESKLGEIVGFLSVLPSLTQKIGGLESKVDSLEALLVDRNDKVEAITNELNRPSTTFPYAIRTANVTYKTHAKN